MHDAVIVGDVAWNQEFARIDDDALPASIPVQPEIEHWQRRLHCYVDLDRCGQLKSAGPGHLLVGQQLGRESTQAGSLGRVEPRDERQRR